MASRSWTAVAMALRGGLTICVRGSDILGAMAMTEATPDRRWRSAADVLIGGGGFAGLALAIALRQGLGDRFRVVLADPALGKTQGDDPRASAIAAAARAGCSRRSASGTRSRTTRSRSSTWWSPTPS